MKLFTDSVSIGSVKKKIPQLKKQIGREYLKIAEKSYSKLSIMKKIFSHIGFPPSLLFSHIGFPPSLLFSHIGFPPSLLFYHFGEKYSSGTTNKKLKDLREFYHHILDVENCLKKFEPNTLNKIWCLKETDIPSLFSVSKRLNIPFKIHNSK